MLAARQAHKLPFETLHQTFPALLAHSRASKWKLNIVSDEGVTPPGPGHEAVGDVAAPGVGQQLGQLRSWELEAAAHQLDGLVVVEQLLQDQAAVQVHASVPGLQCLPGKIFTVSQKYLQPPSSPGPHVHQAGHQGRLLARLLAVKRLR